MEKSNTFAYAKCILAGEHAVLRGHRAIVFPVKGCALSGKFAPSGEHFSIEFSGRYGQELRLIFWGVLEEACKKLNVQRDHLKGTWHLENQIPIGGGLGASAAICVSVARFFQAQGQLQDNEIYEFARDLEHLFHGESSGVDIAAAMSEGAMSFMRGGEVSPLNVKWQPNLYVSYSGRKGVTSECVNKVKELIQRNPELGEKIDNEMAEAVKLSEMALADETDKAITRLANAIDQGSMCFDQWGLINDSLRKHMSFLLENGALAVKPTGSGLGGYVLSLWKNKSPLDDLLPVTV